MIDPLTLLLLCVNAGPDDCRINSWNDRGNIAIVQMCHPKWPRTKYMLRKKYDNGFEEGVDIIVTGPCQQT